MFAVKASRGLKPLFPLCLADSASQNNKKKVKKKLVLLLPAVEKWLEYMQTFPELPSVVALH